MQYINQILSEIYNMDEYSTKGKSTNARDYFIIKRAMKYYVVVIVEISSLEGTNCSYDYALYSIVDKTCIGKNEVVYQEIVDNFPKLELDLYKSGKPDFMKNRKLLGEFDEILGKLIIDGKLTDEDMNHYSSYLEEMETMKSKGLSQIYDNMKQIEK